MQGAVWKKFGTKYIDNANNNNKKKKRLSEMWNTHNMTADK